MTKVVALEEVITTDAEHSTQVTTITVDESKINKPKIIIDHTYFITKNQWVHDKRTIEIGEE